MLDRTKIIKEITSRVGELQTTIKNEFHYAQTLWNIIAADPIFNSRMCEGNHQYVIPSWTGLLSEMQNLLPLDVYHVLAVDGSQIYPDRHQGAPCFLINIGAVQLSYTKTQGAVTFDSVPYLIFEGQEHGEYTPEIINTERTQRELETGLDLMLKNKSAHPTLFLVDGSLIFWYLQQTPGASSDTFLGRYLTLLEQFYEHKNLLASYISLPKSKDLVNVLRIAAQEDGSECSFQHLADSSIAQFYLKPGTRSRLFQSHAPVTISYPEHSKPYFFFLHTGFEIARIEIPAWIALNNERLDLVSRIIYDQALKGHGYPVSLAEAHEQAVVTHADKDFFYHLLYTMMPSATTFYGSSQKSIKKRRMSV